LLRIGGRPSSSEAVALFKKCWIAEFDFGTPPGVPVWAASTVMPAGTLSEGGVLSA